MRWTHGSAIALVMLAIVLGHDVLMAAAPHQAEVDLVLSRVATSAIPDLDGDDTHDVSLTSEAPLRSLCPVPDTTPASTQPLPLDGPLLGGIAPVMALLFIDPVEVPLGDHIPPSYPPAVRRALLQVFLN